MDLDPFIRFEAEQLPAQIAEWASPDVFREQLRDGLSSDVAQRTEVPFAERYQLQCPMPGVSASEYMLREIDAGDDGRMLAGIHFLSMDVRRPFVGVLARTKALQDRSGVERIARRLQREFSRFHPQCWRVWASSSDSALELIAGTEVDMLVVAGRLDALRAMPGRDVGASLSLEDCEAAHVHAEYVAMFERFFAAHPEWRGGIQIENEESLRQAQTQGLLARARVAGQTAGFFAAVPARERALQGFLVLEQILDTPFRGRGLAPAFQRMLFEQLARRGAEPRATVFGHIAGGNVASLRTAQSVGRREVYRTVFLPFQ